MLIKSHFKIRTVNEPYNNSRLRDFYEASIVGVYAGFITVFFLIIFQIICNLY